MLARPVARFHLIPCFCCLATRSTYPRPFAGSSRSARLTRSRLGFLKTQAVRKVAAQMILIGPSTLRPFSPKRQIPALTHDPFLSLLGPAAWLDETRCDRPGRPACLRPVAIIVDLLVGVHRCAQDVTMRDIFRHVLDAMEGFKVARHGDRSSGTSQLCRDMTSSDVLALMWPQPMILCIWILWSISSSRKERTAAPTIIVGFCPRGEDASFKGT